MPPLSIIFALTLLRSFGYTVAAFGSNDSPRYEFQLHRQPRVRGDDVCARTRKAITRIITIRTRTATRTGTNAIMIRATITHRAAISSERCLEARSWAHRLWN